MRRYVRLVCVAATLGLLAGCAMPPATVQQATMQNLQVLRQSGAAPVALGDFVLAPGKPAKMDKSIAARAGVLPAPQGSYALYLKETLAAELKAAGKLDTASGIVISAMLTRSELTTDLPTGRAAVGATFKVTKAGKTVYEKPLLAQAEWQSSFVGAIEIPMALDKYTSLYSTLVTTLLADADFQAATRP